MTFSDVLTKINGVRTPTTFDINDVMRGGGGVIMKRHNVIFSKIVWRRPAPLDKNGGGRRFQRKALYGHNHYNIQFL